MTLRRRLSLLYMGSTAVFLALAAFTAAFFYERGLRGLADRKLLASADEAADALAAGASPAAITRLGRLSESLDGFFVRVEAPGGRTIYSSDPQFPVPAPAARPDPGAAAAFGYASLPGGARLRTIALAPAAPAAWALLELGLPLPSPLGALPPGSWLLLGAAALLLLAASGAAGWLLAGRALAPVERIAETAKRVGEGALNGRIPRHAGEDELGRLIDVLNGMLAALEAYSIKLRQFASNVTHQLKTPLTVMRGQTEVALLGKPGRDEAVAVLEGNLAELETMTRVVEDILEYSRLDAREGAAPRPEKLDVLAARIAKKAAVLALPKSQKIETSLEPVSAPALAGKLEQALLNVLDNAVRHTPAGGRIAIRTSREGGLAVIAVEDSGPGVKKEDLSRLFERGYSTSGSGLGLGLARAMLESFGGRIEVSSEPGRGLTVRVLLPGAPDQNLPSSPKE